MKTIQISEETFEKIRDQLEADEAIELDDLDELVGQKWFFRTVTFHLVGEVTKRLGSFLVLKKASWVPSSGRFTQAIKDGTLDEVEPVGDALINLNSVTDAFPWRHKLPTQQK